MLLRFKSTWCSSLCDVNIRRTTGSLPYLVSVALAFLGALFVFVLVGCSEEQRAAGPVRKIVDGVERIENPSDPLYGIKHYEGEELWRWELDAEADSLRFGTFDGALADADGNLFLLDATLDCVHVIGPDGRERYRLGQRGEGPGDIMWPTDMFFVGAGTLGVVTHVSRLVLYDLASRSARVWEPLVEGADRYTIHRCRVLGNSFCIVVRSAKRQEKSWRICYYLDIFGRDGKATSRCFENCFEWTPSGYCAIERLHSPPAAIATSSSGYLVVAPYQDRYEMQVFDATGRLVRTIARQYEHLMRTQGDIELVKDLVKGSLAHTERVEVMPFYPDIVEIKCFDDTLFVMASRGAFGVDSPSLACDVFSLDGVFLERRVFDVPVDLTVDLTLFAAKDVLVVRHGEQAIEAGIDGVPLPQADSYEGSTDLVCYRLRPAAGER